MLLRSRLRRVLPPPLWGGARVRACRAAAPSDARCAEQHARHWTLNLSAPLARAVCEWPVRFHDVYRQSEASIRVRTPGCGSRTARLAPVGRWCGARGAVSVWWLTSCAPLVEASSRVCVEARLGRLPSGVVVLQEKRIPSG
eukprot:scaffold1734_cov227-Pavlova_lutheri.AAC.1